jgi:hypothetical protein
MMARRFKKKAGIPGVLSLPGLPGIGNDTVVEGDEYARFCPAVLEEVFDEAPAKKPAAKKAAAAPPPPPPPPEPDEDEPEDEPEEDDGEPPSMDWLKSELVEYAEGLGLKVDGMTKRQILDAIEAEED